MTTDNRTNGPTPEQVEAAIEAHAAHKGAWVDEFKEMVCPECGWCYMTADERRPDNKPSNEVVFARVDAHRMRAALVAAAGAAPQAPAINANCMVDADGCEAGTAPQGEGECLCILHYEDRGGGHSELVLEPEPACPEHGRGLVALPSSTVDKDALAEEIGRHKLVHVSVSRKSAFCMCNSSVKAGVDDNVSWFAKHRARAVAEWLKGQER